MDTVTKTEIDAAKTASKRVVQKTTEAAGYLMGNKIADKITSAGKTKSKEKEDATSNNVPRFITKKWIEVHLEPGAAENRY